MQNVNRSAIPAKAGIQDSKNWRKVPIDCHSEGAKRLKNLSFSKYTTCENINSA